MVAAISSPAGPSPSFSRQALMKGMSARASILRFCKWLIAMSSVMSWSPSRGKVAPGPALDESVNLLLARGLDFLMLAGPGQALEFLRDLSPATPQRSARLRSGGASPELQGRRRRALRDAGRGQSAREGAGDRARPEALSSFGAGHRAHGRGARLPALHPSRLRRDREGHRGIGAGPARA